MKNRLTSNAWLLTGMLIAVACSDGTSSPGFPTAGTGGQYGDAVGGSTDGVGGNPLGVGGGIQPGLGGGGTGGNTIGAGGGIQPVLGGATGLLGGATGVTGGGTSLGGATGLLGGASGLLGGASGLLGGATGLGGGGATGVTGGTAGDTGGTTGDTGGGTSVSGGAGGVPPELGGYHIHGDWAGFAFTFATNATISPSAEEGYNDMLTQDGPYCARGDVPLHADYLAIAAVGFNANQPKVEDAPVNTVVSSGNGLLVNVSNPSGTSLRVQIEDGTDPDAPDAAEHRWCANLSTFDQDVKIPWEAFNTECWDANAPATGAFNPATPLAKVIVYLPGEATVDQSFDFCVNDIGPDNVVSRGTGQIVASCNNSVSWPMASMSDTQSALSSNGAYGIQANGWSMDGGQLAISTLGGCGFRVDTHNCSKTVATDGPCSFPSVYRGVRYGGENTTSSGGFPKQVSAITSIPTCLGWSPGSGTGYNVSFDVWFNSSSGGTTAQKFLMLWFRMPDNWQPAGDFPEADGVMIGDQVWSRWYGPNTDNQPVVSYAAPSPRASGQAYSFDLKDFIDDAVAEGHISPSDYLISVMGGLEIWAGGQGASIDGFSVDVQ